MAMISTVGQPSDSVGIAGDFAVDTQNHFFWGPKTTTWAGTAFSMAGPTGPGILTGQGAPAAGTGVPGNAYVDLSTGDLWGPKVSPTSWPAAPSSRIVGAPGKDGKDGAAGTPGPTYLTGMSAAAGAYAVADTVTLSATPYVMVLPGSATPSTFVPIAPSALMGMYCYSSVAATVTLYDATASAAIYTKAITAGQSFSSGYFATDTYPLVPGHTYQWQVTGAASAKVQIQPFYLMPANSPGLCVNMVTPAGFSAPYAFTATAVGLPPLGLTTAFGLMAHVPPRTGGIYSAVATYTPSAGTPATASVQLTLWYGALTTGTGAAVGYTFNPVTATGLPQTILAPRLWDLTSLAAGNFFYWKATGTGTGTLSVTLMPLV